MAVFRIEKTQNYTVMSNHHLRSKTLSLKAKGLLSQILSLPEDWDYTLAGLSSINRESVDAVRSAVLELEQAGYLTRSRERKENGKFGGTEYIIREKPLDEPTPENDSTRPVSVSPTQMLPTWENPIQANSTLEKTTQISKEKTIKDLQTTDLQNTDSIPFPPHTPPDYSNRQKQDGIRTEAVAMSTFDVYREIIHDNIDYENLLEQYKYDHERIDEIVALMLETVCTARKTILISSDEYPVALVKSKFLKLNSEHIGYVLDCMKKNTTEIRNIKKYLLAVLFNAASTMDSYYSSLVSHHMATGKLSKGGDA